MKKRVGILTFHNVPNYGAALQAFASVNYMKKKYGIESSIIDYQGYGNGDEFSIEHIKNNILKSNNIVKRLAKYLLFLKNKKAYKTKLEKFDAFRRRYYKLDHDVENMNSRYDLIFYGSDQIWNPNITKGYDDIYFAKNIVNPHIIRAGFAVSCGDVDEVKNDEDFLESIKSFDYIGARESSLVDYLQCHKIPCSLMVDPSFLLSAEDYMELLEIPKRPRPYLLVYELQRDSMIDDLALKIAKIKGLDIIHICGYLNFNKFQSKGCFDVGPVDFVKLICNAEYVLTNSFHGCAYSLIFQKDFNVVLPRSRTSRITDLLSKLCITDRIVTDKQNVTVTPISYTAVNSALKYLIAETELFIHNIIIKES